MGHTFYDVWVVVPVQITRRYRSRRCPAVLTHAKFAAVMPGESACSISVEVHLVIMTRDLDNQVHVPVHVHLTHTIDNPVPKSECRGARLTKVRLQESTLRN
jgi:hypothetical protein